MAELSRTTSDRGQPFLDRTKLRLMFWVLWLIGVTVVVVALVFAAQNPSSKSMDDAEFWRVTVPGIATAAGTAALAIAAGYLALGQRVDERSKAEAEARDQARRVVTIYTDSASRGETEVEVINASERPVFDVWTDGARLEGQAGTYRPSENDNYRIAVLPPGATRTMIGTLNPGPTTHWTDSSSQRWTRQARNDPNPA